MRELLQKRLAVKLLKFKIKISFTTVRATMKQVDKSQALKMSNVIFVCTTCTLKKWTQLSNHLQRQSEETRWSRDNQNTPKQLVWSKPNRVYIYNNYLWVLIDETTDDKKLYVLNIIMGKLTQNKQDIPSSLASKEWNKTKTKQ